MTCAARALPFHRRGRRLHGLVGAAGILILAPFAIPTGVAATSSPTPTLTNSGPSFGPPNSQVTYKYTWNYNSCKSANPADPGALIISLVWDDPSQSIGSNQVTVNKKRRECDGAVSGTVPAGTPVGSHLLTARLQYPGTKQPVPGSDAAASTAYTVTPPTPTPTPAPTPTAPATAVPTPVATPTPTPSFGPSSSDLPPLATTDTPFVTASPTPASQVGAVVPSTATGTGASGPPGGWVLDGLIVALVIAAICGALFWRSRRVRPPDSLEFIR